MRVGPKSKKSKKNLYPILDRGDFRRILLALTILATFGAGELGVFWFTMDGKPELLMQPSQKIGGNEFNEHPQSFGQQQASLLGEKREKHYLQIWSFQEKKDSLVPTVTYKSGQAEDPSDCRDLVVPGSTVNWTAGTTGVCK